MRQQSTSPAEFGRVQELMYEVGVGELMTTAVITVSRADSMRYVKELLRSHRISGTPVVDDRRPVGIVSVEDIIRALEEGCLDATVEERMSRNVVSIGVDEKAVEAVRKFSKTGLGRLPVLDKDGFLVGIITPGDLAGRLLTILERRYLQEEAKKPRCRRAIDELVSDDTRIMLRYKVAAKDFDHAGEASSSLKRALQSLNISAEIVRRAAIVAYEAEMNLVIHSDGGYLSAEVGSDHVTILAEDGGPGIQDIEKAMQPGYSTAPDWVRELGFGAGIGLNNIQKCSDEFKLESELGKGTLVRSYIQLGGQR
ncbi:MAG: CBS domain-containing protein [Chloroflexota bacterium]